MEADPLPRSAVKRGLLLAIAVNFWREMRWRVVAGFALMLLGSLTEGVSIVMLIPVVQHFSPGVADGAPHALPVIDRFVDMRRIDLGVALTGLVVVVFLQTGLMRAKDVYVSDMLLAYSNRLRLALFESIGHSAWHHLAKYRLSDLEHALTSDVTRIHVAAHAILTLLQTLVLLGVYTILSLLISVPMTLLAIGVGALVLMVLYPVRRRAAAFGRTMTMRGQAQYRTVSEFLSGVKIAKTLNAEERYTQLMATTLAHSRQDSFAYNRLIATSASIFQMSSIVALAVFVYVAVKYYSLPPDNLIVLILIFMRVSPRFSSIQTSLQDVFSNLFAFEHYTELRADCDRHPDEASNVPAPSLIRELRFEDVSYSHTEGRQAVSGASFAVAAGSIVAVVGPSGSGKSTVADLLIGLLVPDRGRITIDGAPLTRANSRAWRAIVAYVPQDVFLIHDTLRENMRLAYPAADDDAIWAALSLAEAARFARALPAGLDTVLGERGTRLSGGERQRIALARALLRQPRLLILDEATSSLDWENQALIARTVERLRGSMTILTIAHRPSMIAFADSVISIRDGKVVENGLFAALRSDPNSLLNQMIAGESPDGS